MSARHGRTLVGLLAAAAISSACPTAVGDAADEPGDAIMLSNNTAVTYDGSAWNFGGTGATANVIFAPPYVSEKFERVSDTSMVFEGVDIFSSVEGPESFTLSSSLQSAVATWNAGPRTYTIAGLSGSPVYGPSDSFEVTATVDGTPQTVTVPAPAEVGTADQLLGAPAGWDTTVSFPDGGFDLMYVFVTGQGGTMGGQSGMMRFVRAEDMSASGGRRSAPLMDMAAADAFAARGLTPTAIYVAAYNEDLSDPFFDAEVPIQAGRMFQLNPLDLGL